jgi:trimeric autotransporter adhesin
MGSINIDNTGSGGAITLSSDGTSLLLGGTAVGGGVDLYAANEVSVTAQPSATGDDAVAIGDSAAASGANDFAIGRSATASGSDSIALGYSTTASGNGSFAALNSTASGSAAIAIGGTAVSSGTSTLAIGYGTDATSDFSTAVGRNAQARATSANAFGRDAYAIGTQATAIGDSYASGTDSFAAAIGNNTSSYGATGGYSVSIGYQSKATVQGVSIGTSTTASGLYGTALGLSTTASGQYSFTVGRSNTASGNYSSIVGGFSNTADASYSHIIGGFASTTNSKQYSTVIGPYAKAKAENSLTFGSNALGTGSGSVQKSTYPLFADTTDATATVLTTDNSSAGSYNQVSVGSDFAVAFSGLIVAREQASGGTDCAAWEVKGLLVQASANSTVTLVNSAITVIDNTPGWTIALSTDTTNGSLSITATGAASTNIRWLATIETADLNYG